MHYINEINFAFWITELRKARGKLGAICEEQKKSEENLVFCMKNFWTLARAIHIGPMAVISKWHASSSSCAEFKSNLIKFRGCSPLSPLNPRVFIFQIYTSWRVSFTVSSFINISFYNQPPCSSTNISPSNMIYGKNSKFDLYCKRKRKQSSSKNISPALKYVSSTHADNIESKNGPNNKNPNIKTLQFQTIIIIMYCWCDPNEKRKELAASEQQMRMK